MRALVVAVLVVGCRIGFDPVTDGGAHVTDGAPTTCTVGEVCSVDCPIGAPCVVDCAETSVCRVRCFDREEGCTVINCGPTCSLDCGDAAAIRTGATLVCP